MCREHRIAGAGHQDVDAPDVRLVDIDPGLVGDRLRLLVGAFAQPYALVGPGQLPTVGFGPTKVRLEHRTRTREVGAQPVQHLQRRVGRRMVLHVERDRRTRIRRRPADVPRVGLGQLLVEFLTQRGELHAHFGGRRQTAGGEIRQQRDVLVPGVLGLLGGERVLAEIVERDPQVLVDEVPGDIERVATGRAGDEATNDVSRDGSRLHEPGDPG